LKTKEKPQINHMAFMSATDGAKNDPQLMILCTNYGLLVFDFTVDWTKEESKESKESSEKQLDLVIKYKISVIPEEQVIDCVILDPKRPKESQLLVCCASGSYVILRRS